MKTLIRTFLFLLACFVPLASNAATVQNLSWQELQNVLRSNPSQNVIVEFYNSANDNLDCDKCQQQEPVFAELASRYDSRIAFVRVDVSSAPQLKDLGVVAIYPTHLFVRHNVPAGQEMVARKIMGYLSLQDFSQLIPEFFEIN